MHSGRLPFSRGVHQTLVKAITEMVPNLIWAWLFWSPRNLGPKKFGPREIWAPRNLVPTWKSSNVELVSDTNSNHMAFSCGAQTSWGPNFLGTKFLRPQIFRGFRRQSPCYLWIPIKKNIISDMTSQYGCDLNKVLINFSSNHVVSTEQLKRNTFCTLLRNELLCKLFFLGGGHR